MRLETLLELDLRKMRNSDAALEVLRQTWRGQDCPTEGKKLARTLGLAMDKCERRGLDWPKGFLMRKGQLERGEFQPRSEMRSLSNADSIVFTAPTHPKIPQEWIQQAIAEEVRRIKNKTKA
jgi:hypothetical protein